MKFIETKPTNRADRKYAYVLLDSGKTVEIVVPENMTEEDIMVLAEIYNQPETQPVEIKDIKTATIDDLILEIKKRSPDDIQKVTDSLTEEADLK